MTQQALPDISRDSQSFGVLQTLFCKGIMVDCLLLRFYATQEELSLAKMT